MPISEEDEAETPQAGADLLEFLEQRRHRQAQQRRQRILAVAIAGLTLVTVMLAVSNVMLLRRVAPTPVRIVTGAPAPPSLPATAPTPAPARSAPDQHVAATPPAPARSEASRQAAATPPAPVRPGPDRPAAVLAGDEPLTLPTIASRATEPARHPEPAAAAAPEPDRARRTARWLVQTYGRLDAENRAARVADFYTGRERAFWQRVLVDVRSEPTP